MSSFRISPCRDENKVEKRRYWISLWQLSNVRQHEKYRKERGDIKNLKFYGKKEQNLRTVDMYSNNQDFGYGQKFLVELVKHGTDRMAVRNKAAWKAALRRMHCPLSLKDTGDPSYRLGILYALGDTVKRDDKHAKTLFLAAAEIGHAAAQCALGEMYEDGRGGTAKDAWRASLWYAKAAEKGHPIACYRVGMLLEHGGGGMGLRGVPQDRHMALEYYRIAAKAGLPDAMFNCGVLSAYLDGDYISAVEWYKKAGLEHGHPAALNNLACQYERGQCVPKDRARAVELYKMAADLGDDYAQANMALLHAQSAKRKEKAAQWFHKLVEAPTRASLLQEHLMVEHSTSMATESTGAGWLTKKVKAQQTKQHFENRNRILAEAQLNIGSIYARAHNQHKKSAEWFLKAATQGNTSAMFNYAMMCQEGLGVPKDLDEARKWMERAADKGDSDARYNLGMMDAGIVNLPLPSPMADHTRNRPGSRHSEKNPQISSIVSQNSPGSPPLIRPNTSFTLQDSMRPGTTNLPRSPIKAHGRDVPMGVYFHYFHRLNNQGTRTQRTSPIKKPTAISAKAGMCPGGTQRVGGSIFSFPKAQLQNIHNLPPGVLEMNGPVKNLTKKTATHKGI
jgi:uncharacterized protein